MKDLKFSIVLVLTFMNVIIYWSDNLSGIKAERIIKKEVSKKYVHAEYDASEVRAKMKGRAYEFRRGYSACMYDVDNMKVYEDWYQPETRSIITEVMTSLIEKDKKL